MSNIRINAFFKFSKVKTINQTLDIQSKTVSIKTEPDERYKPRCYKCNNISNKVHSYHDRVIRDMNIFDAKTYITYSYRKIRCSQCGIVVEDLNIVEPNMKVTKRLANYILELCKVMSIKEIARHLELDWKTIKKIHKSYLRERCKSIADEKLRILAMDEISIRKSHRYLTVILNWETGKILWVGEGRRYETVKGFFDSLSKEQKGSIEAVAMDMWDPYIKAVKESCPKAAIVFDKFHVVKAFGKVIDKVRNAEYKKADKAEKGIIKGSKYLLLKNRENLTEEEKPRLKEVLKLNENLTTVYILKDYLKRLWDYRYARSAKKALDNWCRLANESGIRAVKAFAKTLQRYAYGIINHCKFPIHTSRLEGINNKIKLIKRKAYGFHDIEYFTLIIRYSFSFCN